MVGAFKEVQSLPDIDQDKRPLNPIHPAQARQLLSHKKAAIFRRFPFTLILQVVALIFQPQKD
ncbi:RRXRR domain-containing protein [Symplocastrum sp. BBK-W-15]|uniref:RRXRR domain-containing protein n=1 Tax=Limnofasciculus baicalensis BBK-W-15 TaxID=2699891 RepID=A0AAE3GWM4_9CYAN|nr:RRXRR domain-containing protein [Limnofasciculus baicalensis]MCP2731118.1 RRXRR domain-containing protein [Limnofasciculus baicalensis BBK-W-15]